MTEEDRKRAAIELFESWKSAAIDEIGHERGNPIQLSLGVAILYGHILAFGKACLPQPFVKRRDLRPQNRGRASEQQPYYRHRRLLRVCRERPHGSRAAEQRDEVASLHSITSSAATSRPGGTVRPSAFAVVRLITNSILVGNSTGRSPGLVPFKILST